MTHEYLMEVIRYFGGATRFQVEASNKDEAKAIGIKRANELFGRDNIINGTLRVVKKLKSSFGES